MAVTRELFPGATRRSRRKEARELQKHEILMGIHLGELGVDYFREYQFHEQRRWRFDFALPAELVAIEIEGGIHGFTNHKGEWQEKGGHTTGTGYQDDLDKYNSAAILGWTVLRFSVEDVNVGCAKHTIAKFLRAKKAGFMGLAEEEDLTGKLIDRHKKPATKHRAPKKIRLGFR